WQEIFRFLMTRTGIQRLAVQPGAQHPPAMNGQGLEVVQAVVEVGNLQQGAHEANFTSCRRPILVGAGLKPWERMRDAGPVALGKGRAIFRAYARSRLQALRQVTMPQRA